MKQTEWFLKLVRIFLYSGPILDMLTAVMLQVFHIDITMGMIIRFLFLFVASIYLLCLYQGAYKKQILVVLGIIFSYLIVFSIVVFIDKGSGALLYELKNTIKTFYFPLLLLTFFALGEEKQDYLPKRYLYLIYLIYLLGIFVPDILGIGFASYAVTKTGSVGFFNAANEISAILSILMPFFLYYLYKEKNYLKMLLLVSVLIYVILSIGTKGPLLSFFIVLGVWGIIFMWRLLKEKYYKKVSLIVTTFLVLVATMILLLPRTAFYQNIKIHLDFLEVEHVSEVFTNEELLDHFIFSSRLKFMKNTARHYSEAPLLQKSVGIGYIENYGTDQVSTKMVEMDFFDIFFRHGVLGFIIYGSIYGYFLVYAFRNIKKEEDFGKKVTFFLSYFLSILLAFITGHVLLAPAVSIFVTLLLAQNDKKGLLP